MSDHLQDAYADARFTAEISNRMRVPDRIQLAGASPAGVAASGERPRYNDLGMRQRDPRLDMQVPDRILLAGDNSHIASKSTPRELQLENSVLPPTLEHVRVSTPPRSIRLDEHSFPSATDDESPFQSSTPTLDVAEDRRGGSETGDSQPQTSSLALPSENLTPSEEIRLLRRQMAKLNHRLMAVELENQQQQQREMVLTAIVTAYFLGKLILWINRSL